MKFATKPLHYPSHLRHVATLPCEIKNSNFLTIFSRYGRKCEQIAFLIHLSTSLLCTPSNTNILSKSCSRHCWLLINTAVTSAAMWVMFQTVKFAVSSAAAGPLLHFGHSRLPSQEPDHPACAQETVWQVWQGDQVSLSTGVWSRDLAVLRWTMEISLQSVFYRHLLHNCTDVGQM